MAKLNLGLLALLVACALALVSAQHQARKLVAASERALNHARELDVEYGRLQLEAGTWALHARIEKIARTKLQMRAPDARRVRTVTLGQGASR